MMHTNKSKGTSMASRIPAAADDPVMEMREASPAHFLTKIESFSLLDKHGIDKYETTEFVAGGYKWRLIIYPSGHESGKDGDYVSVYLAMADTSSLPANWEVNVVFLICLFNQISCNYRYALGRTRRFLALKTEWGFSKFISKKDLTDPSNGYLIDDNCVFGAEVFVNKNKAVIECLSLKNVRVPYKREFKIPDFSTLKDEWTSDEFIVGDRKWTISLYLNGKGEGTGRSLSIFLYHVASKNSCAPSERVKACYTICLKNQASDEHHVKETGSSWFTSSKDGWGWTSFIELARINDPHKGFILEDCCVLEIELSVQAIAAENVTSKTSRIIKFLI